MSSVLIVRALLGFFVWQWMTGSYSFGQVPEIHSPGSAISNANPTELPLSIYILYFDQSSPKLRSGVKATLNSIARQLVRQPTLMATVVGYTDDIGKRELNLVLAERRAKTVAIYLKQQGVPDDQVIAKWEGPDTEASVDNQESTKTISRRVIIQLSPN